MGFDILLFVNLLVIIIWQNIFTRNFEMCKEEFEDTKRVITIRVSKKNRQHNGQKKMYKRTNNDLQNIHIKQKYILLT